MKFLLLLVLIALPLGYLFGEEEYTRFTRIEAISKSPGFAPAVVEEVVKIEGKKHTSYRVRYRYEVNGKRFYATTTSTDQQGAMRYIAQQDMQVAYSTRDPAIGIIKRYYDLRNPRETLASSLFITSVFSLGISLPISLVVWWRLGWLKRRKKL